MKDKVLGGVRRYVTEAEAKRPEEMPITYAAIATATSIDWRTVKKWGEAEIEQAQKRQERNLLSAKRREEEAYADLIRQRDEQIEVLKRENASLLERLVLMEGNARRIGIDPDEYYKPLQKPDRRHSRAGRAGKRQ